MFRIAICDDDLNVCSEIEKIILEYAKNTSQEIDIDVFVSGEELCKYMKQGVEYSLIFLDIELKLLNGVRIGKIIREEMNNEFVHILYISATQRYAMDLFEVRPLNFLLKPLSKEKILKNLKKSIQLMNQENKVFEFKIGKTFYKIPYKEILYFVSQGKKVKIVTKNSIREYYGKLANIRQILPRDHFLTIHKSYIANAYYIMEYQYECLKLVNEEVLPISQTYRKTIREKLLKQKRGRRSV